MDKNYIISIIDSNSIKNINLNEFNEENKKCEKYEKISPKVHLEEK